MMTQSWITSVLGVLAGVANYLVQLGPNLPTDAHGWGAAILSGILAGLGLAAKDGNKSNAENPVPVRAVDLS